MSGGSKKLNEAFGYVDDRFLDMVETEHRDRPRPVRLRFAVACAACICVLLALPAGVMADHWFGLRNLLVPDSDKEHSGDYESSAAESDPTSYPVESDHATIALSGYQGSPEAEALAEWNEFLTHYDTDHRILDALGNGIFLAEGREDWSLYNVYSMEMGEKLDEIAEKYGLKLHTGMDIVEPDELEDRVGGELLSGDCIGYTAYIYEDGSFQLDGDVELKDCGAAGFQFRRVVKGSFDEVALNIGQVEDYAEWQYVSDCGEPVLLELGSGKALIFLDCDNCFIAVNVLAGSDQGMTRGDLQDLADMIDFRILKN